jgi:hypothetical protein
MYRLALASVLALSASALAPARVALRPASSAAAAAATAPRLGAVPTKERTRTRPKQGTNTGTSRGDRPDRPDGASKFEWGIDADSARGDGDAFHILLLNDTFSKPRMSVPYAAGALCLVLQMAEGDAMEHSAFAMAQGFSCLGAWRRDECLRYCEQLTARDLSVRAVPGVKGKQAWQGGPANVSPDALGAGR